MSEKKLPNLHIHLKKKHSETSKQDTLPNLDMRQKQHISSREYVSTDQAHEQYQPSAGQSRLGKDIYTGDYVDVPQASRRQGLYIIGIQGTGKSVLIENLIIQDIKQGIGVCVLDPHGDLINAVLARVDRREEDVILLDIMDYHSPFGINLFACSDPTNPVEVQKIVNQVMHIFEKLYAISRSTPLMAQYLRNCTYTLIANPGYTMADIPLLLREEQCRKKLVANVSYSPVRLFWQQYEDMKPTEQREYANFLLNKLEEFLQPLTLNIIGQAQTTINLSQVMDERKILLVKLNPRLEDATTLIGSMIIAKILNAAYTRADLPTNKRKQFNLYADEFQRFATEDFATLLEEARKYGISTTIAHQNRGQLDSKNSQLDANLKDRTRSAANLVVFRVNSKDADDLAGEFDTTPQEAWEEEIEPEWHERIEEEVEMEDTSTEPVKAISQNPVDFLHNHTHENRRVRDLKEKIITPLFSALTAVDEKTGVWGDVPMGASRTQLLQGKDMLNLLLIDVMEGRLSFPSSALTQRVVEVAFVLRGLWGVLTGIRQDGLGTLNEEELGWRSLGPNRLPESEPPPAFRHSLDAFVRSLSQVLAQSPLFVKQATLPSYSVLKEQLGTTELVDYLTHKRTFWKFWAGFDTLATGGGKWFSGYFKDPEKQKQAGAEAIKAEAALADKLASLFALCVLLAQEPIMVDTGEVRPRPPRKQKQIHYLTHPRKPSLIHNDRIKICLTRWHQNLLACLYSRRE
jgi:hypothetical protein